RETVPELAARARALAATDVVGALALADQAVASDAACVDAWTARAAVRLVMNDFSAALEDATRAIALDERHALALAIRGSAHRHRGESAEAVADLKRATDIDPREGAWWQELGDAQSVLPRGRESARESYTRAIELEPRRADHWDGRSEARRMTGDIRGALEDSNRAVEL